MNIPESHYDDWQPKHDHWRMVTVCECGFRLEPDDKMPYADVCPECGSTEKWESFIARLEWEHSHKKYVMLLLERDMFSYASSEAYAAFVHNRAEDCSKRNVKLVRLTGGQ